tara:strand:- start:2032 stop:2451 length:420 start_codon:yes stop_codon:yes gene_type:complete
MQFKKLEDKFVVRIDKGEEVVETLKQFCTQQNIKLGSISAIGATNKVEVGFFVTSTKEYHSKVFEGDFEITSLLGNITTMDGETYLHLHITLSDESHNAFGGHLNSAVISATCEVFIDPYAGEVDREKDEDIGLNLIKF